MKKIKNISNLFTFIALGVILAGCAAKSGSGYGDGAGGYGDSETGGIGLGTLKRIHFEFDQSVISGEALNILKDNAKVMKGNSKMRVLIEGHCDERGTNEYNIALGERRAKTTMNQMVSLGISRSRLETKSWGEERPLDGAKAESAWKLNRRAEFIVLAK